MIDTPGTQPHIFLIPGFFGFTSIGELRYFRHVESFLEQEMAARGVRARVVTVPTLPTAGLRQRTTRLLNTIVNQAGEEEPIYLVGHSTGGLDARLLASPGVDLDTNWAPESVAKRIRAIVTVSTPHHGTPVAGFFTSIIGQKLLSLLSSLTLYTLRFGQLPLSMMLRIGAFATRIDDAVGLDRSLLDELYASLLGDLSEERRIALESMVKEVSTDQRLMPQLAPEALDLFNASTGNRPGVGYGSVITRANPPGVRSAIRAGLDPYAQVSHSLFSFVWLIASRTPTTRIPQLSFAHREALERGFGALPTWRDSDGVVPTLSQPWGQVLHTAYGDHLDTVGHFDDPNHDPPHDDWLAAGTGFRRPDFEALWRAIATFLAQHD
ncbi:MAG: triacylglycerol lipase [Myxococcales bacterium]|nr:triacylglycerol lipase [Myxococcales bacterium]